MADVRRIPASGSHENGSPIGDATEESAMKFDISGNPSYGDLTSPWPPANRSGAKAER